LSLRRANFSELAMSTPVDHGADLHHRTSDDLYRDIARLISGLPTQL
jgi:hypothetical protein